MKSMLQESWRKRERDKEIKRERGKERKQYSYVVLRLLSLKRSPVMSEHTNIKPLKDYAFWSFWASSI